MAITLTAGDFLGSVQGYARVGSSAGTSFGSISAELVAGKTLDYLFTGSNNSIAFVGNQSPTLVTALTVNGNNWTVGSGVYNAGANVTEYSLTTSGGDFANGVAYTVDATLGAVYSGPTYIGKSTANSSISAFTIGFASSGRASGDKLFIAVETANQAIAAPTGFTQVATHSPQSRGTAGVAGGVRLTLFEKTSNGTETTVSIPDSGEHQYAVGIVVRGTSPTIDAGAGNNVAAATACTFGGVTTTVNDCLVITFAATDRDSAGPSFSAQANANLVNLTERHDAGTATGTGGGLVIYTGEKQTAGATGNTTATQAASAAYCWITLALKNTVGGGTPVGTAASNNVALSLAGRQTKPVSLSTEAGVGISLGGKQIRPTGLSSEINGALGLSSINRQATGMATSVESALALAPAGGLLVGLSTEADFAFSLSSIVRESVGLASENDAALARSGIQRKALGLAVEVQTALPLGSVLRRGVGISIEAETALALTGISRRPIGQANENDLALPLSPASGLSVGTAIEVEIAFALSSIAKRAAGLASTTEIAVTLAGINRRPVGLASETSIALARTPGSPSLVGLATETDLALGLNGKQSRPAGIALENGTAFALASKSVRSVGLATSSELALALAGIARKTVGLAVDVEQSLALRLSVALTDDRSPIRTFHDVANDTTFTDAEKVLGFQPAPNKAQFSGRTKIKGFA